MEGILEIHVEGLYVLDGAPMVFDVRESLRILK